MTLLILAGVIVIILVLIYNNLVSSRNAVEQAFGSIDAMLKKRYDLIPNLVETVKTYMKFEKDTLTQISELRTKALSGSLTSDEKVNVENQLSGKLRNVMVAVENYPDLKSSEQFSLLQRSWNETEEQISAARRAYNSAVTQYNNAIEKFPSNLLASAFNHKRKQVFEIPEAERQNVSAKAMFNN
ncbi:MAG TPA: LemA family protein [Cytophagales bacterium]|jgi:LemA protein|nr:LemA family protein [Cytophagales bacterium]